MLYLLMRQANDDDLPVIQARLTAKHITVEHVDDEAAVALLQQIAFAREDEGESA